MKMAVRAIIINNNQLLVMHRNKFGQIYDTLPGGGVESGESLKQALKRELLEETSLSIRTPRLVFIDHAGAPYGDQYVFVCDFQGGEVVMSSSAGEMQLNKLGQNTYIPGWIDLESLYDRPFVSPKLKQHIIKAIQAGWPIVPLEF